MEQLNENQPVSPRIERTNAKILAALALGKTTTLELSSATGLHRATVRLVLDRLMALGLIEQPEVRHLGGRGRPERVYRSRIESPAP